LNRSVEFAQMFLQEASKAFQAGHSEVAFEILVYGALFIGSGLVEEAALFPLTLLGSSAALAGPELVGATVNAAVAPGLSGVVASVEVALSVVDALNSGDP